MNLKDRIRRLDKKKLVSYSLILIISIYSLSFTILYYSISTSLSKTLETLYLPDNYFIVNPDPSSPDLRISFSITNKGFHDLTQFQIDLSLDLYYTEKSNNNEKNAQIFSKIESYSKISPKETYRDTFQGNYDSFNISALENFVESVNVNKSITYLMNVKISGKYYFDIVPFSIVLENFNLTCPDCE